MVDFGLGSVGIPMQEDPNARHERAWYLDFVTAKQRHIQPAQLSCGQGGEFSVQVACDREDRAGDVFGLDSVSADDQC